MAKIEASVVEVTSTQQAEQLLDEAMGGQSEPMLFDPRWMAQVQIADGAAACSECLFYAAEERECRKSPPPRGSGQPFPNVAANAWCGEFLPRYLFRPTAEEEA